MRFIESLFLGIIAALGALLIEAVFYVFGNSDGQTSIIISGYPLRELGVLVILPVIIEEFFKFIIIRQKLEEYSLGRMLIINSMVLGLGFGLVEILLIYLWNQTALSTPQIIIEILIVHTLTAGTIGYLLSQLNPKKISAAIKIIFVASLIHLAYNALSFYRNEALDLVILAFLSVIALFLLINIILFEKKLAP